jgi:hypothetical protein
MQSRLTAFARAFIPLVPLCLGAGCGGGGAEATPAAGGGNPPVTPSAPTGNRSPAISGIAGTTAQVGAVYSFQPDWADPDGDTLTFTATNLPSWAELDPQTGRVHGMPVDGDIGYYEGISITVADALHQVSTQAFSITVVGATRGVATLSWVAPLTRVDGSNLDNLAGYRILFGRQPDDLDHSVFIADPAALSYEIASLDPGTWYFAIVAVSDAGLEGPATTPSMKTI